MTQIEQNITESQRAQALVAAQAYLAALKEKSARFGDQTAKAPAVLSALAAGKTGAAGDPLAAVAPERERANEGGNYYPPAGMPEIYFLMKAMMTDLQATSEIATIDNQVMISQFKNWIQEMDTFAEKSRDALKLQAHESLLQGVSSLVSAGISGFSVARSGWKMGADENEISKLTNDKTALENKRFNRPSADVEELQKKQNSLDLDFVKKEEGGLDALEMDELTSTTSAEARIQTAASSTAEPAAAASAEDDFAVDQDKPLGSQRDQILRKKIQLGEEKQVKIDRNPEAIDNINKHYANRERGLDNHLKLVEGQDEDYKSRISTLEDKIKQTGAKSQADNNWYYGMTQFGSAIGQTANGIGASTIGLAKAQTDYDKNMADKDKQLFETVMRGYSQQVDKEIDTVVQQLSSLEAAMKSLYAAQQNGG